MKLSLQQFKNIENPDLGVNFLMHAEQNQTPWFVAKDVCSAIGVKNPSYVVSRLPNSDKAFAYSDTKGGKQKVLIISCLGLLKIAFSSRKPIADKIVSWVVNEVVPSIMSKGMYATPEVQTYIVKLEERIKYLERKVEQLIEDCNSYRSALEIAQARLHMLDSRLKRMGTPTAPDHYIENVFASKQYAFVADAFIKGIHNDSKRNEAVRRAKVLSDRLAIPYCWTFSKNKTVLYAFDKDVLHFLVFLYDKRLDPVYLPDEALFSLKEECFKTDPFDIPSLNPKICKTLKPWFDGESVDDEESL